MDVVVAPVDGGVVLREQRADGGDGPQELHGWDGLVGRVRELEQRGPRWVWADTAAVYPRLLGAGVLVRRACDLRLGHAVLARSRYLPVPLASVGDARWRPAQHDPEVSEPTLLDLPPEGPVLDLDEVAAEHRSQQRAVAESTQPERLRLLLAAESAGALVAAELGHVGLPFDADVHDAQLTALLGPKPLPGGRPAKLESLAARIRSALQAPGLNPDSAPELLRALHTQGVEAESTRQWELERLRHPVIEPLLEYKKLSRLVSANGWGWLATWVRDGRFRPDYVPSGVVTGRWATRGGGALQLPKQIRAAVVADRGCRLVVADAAQLEPRVLAAMARDEAMARASRAGDLYQALVDEGVVDTRAHAKVAMLGALYGATSGEAGLLMPRLLRSYPRATALVEEAARAGERGEVVTTWLGRSSPSPPESWHEVQRRASLPDATGTDQRRARARARDWGRFTRNFVVQGTAAEWALCWLADLRGRLLDLGEVRGRGPSLVYFLHDEVIVETPTELAEAVVNAVRAAARRAGVLLFGRFPVEFALDVASVQSYAEAG
ncbi:MAG: bifunctional 3'-5' exonuclease/DNA polymerase [Friedmanniella sp.]